MQAFFGMMLDGCAQVFEVSPSAAYIAALANVFTASFAGDFSKLLPAPEFI